MQITETANEGLKRAYTVRIPASDIAERIDGEVTKLAPQVKMPGFRPGKVPGNLIRKMHGPALHQEALNSSIRDAMDRLVGEQRLRPAMQPQVTLGEGYEAGKDAELQVSLEVLPQIASPAIDALAIEKLVVPVTDAEVDTSLQRFASQQKRFQNAEEGHAAATGDQLTVDFVGSIGEAPFEGGSAEQQMIEIGAGRLIPGFEEQLVGAKAGEERRINVTFPADYPAKNLAGKEANFAITVHAVKAPAETAIDEEFAKQLGLEGVDQLRSLLRGQLEQENSGLTRTQMKRALLDTLAAGHDFEVPPSMVEAEFGQITEQLRSEAEREDDKDAALKEIEDESDDYRAIAERRVRLGLLLSEIGQANAIEVTQQEMQALVNQAVQQYRPEDRQRFTEYVQSEPLVAAQLRAPLYEDKVVDFLISKAAVSEREVTRDELQAAIEADIGPAGGHVHGADCDHDHDHGHDFSPLDDETPAETPEIDVTPEAKPAKKKAAAKKPAEAGDADAAPARKPAKKAAGAKAEAGQEPAATPVAKKRASKAEG